MKASHTESTVHDYSYFETSNHEGLNNKDYSHLNLNPSSWEELGFNDQLLYHEDGFTFNLSSIDLNSVMFYEDYEAHNSSDIGGAHVPTGRAVAVAAFVLIFVIGLVGNVLVVYTIARYSAMRRTIYLYFLSLSVADVVYLVVCLPSLSVSYAIVGWKFGRAFCKIENYVMWVSNSVSILTILAAGLDHYIATLHPEKRTYRTTKKALIVVFFIWAVSLIMVAPRVALFDEILVFHFVGATTLCSRVASTKVLQIDTALNFVLLYLLPLLALCVCHVRAARKLWSGSPAGTKHNNQIGKLVIKGRRSMAKLIFAITVVFAFSCLPIHAYHLAEDFDNGNVLLGEIMDRGTVTLLFSFAAKGLNPILHFLFNSSFRRHIKISCKCWSVGTTLSRSAEKMDSVKSNAVHVKDLQYQRSPVVICPRPVSICTERIQLTKIGLVMTRQSAPVNSSSCQQYQPLLQKVCEAQNSVCVRDCEVQNSVCVRDCEVQNSVCVRDCEVQNSVCVRDCEVQNSVCVRDCEVQNSVCVRDCEVQNNVCLRDCEVQNSVCVRDCEVQNSVCDSLSGHAFDISHLSLKKTAHNQDSNLTNPRCTAKNGDYLVLEMPQNIVLTEDLLQKIRTPGMTKSASFSCSNFHEQRNDTESKPRPKSAGDLEQTAGRCWRPRTNCRKKVTVKKV